MKKLRNNKSLRKYLFGVIAVGAVLFVPAGRIAAQGNIVFWNLENFFDYFDDGGSSSDADFSSRGSRRWTKARFAKKCNMIGKALLWMGENYCADGEPPAFVGVAEVENAFVLNRLVNSPVLKKLNYGYVHYDSPDRRGIDVALLYRCDVVRVLSSRPVHIYGDDGAVMRTRDILYVYAELLSEASGPDVAASPPDNKCEGLSVKPSRIHLLVNHHPSKFSGAKASMRGRELAMTALRDVCDSIMRVSDAPIVAMGDFNDTPDGRQFTLIGGQLKNLAEPLSERGEGSIRYDGRWEFIDHFLVGNMTCSDSGRDVSREGTAENGADDRPDEDGGCGAFEMGVVQVPFLMTVDRAHTGFKPMRTYVGPRYVGGVSDHCPILFRFYGNKAKFL